MLNDSLFHRFLIRHPAIVGYKVRSYTFKTNWDACVTTQYRDVEIRVDSEKISEADKLNGVTWKGRTYFKPKANRWWSSSDRKWTPWKNGAPPMGSSLDMIQRFGKVKGQWTYEHSAFYKPVECSDIPE
jgi:hypothetical protein